VSLCFATLLFLHQLIRGKKDCVVKCRTAVAAAPPPAAAPVAASVCICLVILRFVFRGRSQFVKRLTQLGPRRRQVLQQFCFMRELDQEGLVRRSIRGLLHHLVKKGFAGCPFFVERIAYRAAHIYKQTQGEWQIVVPVKVADCLRMSVDHQRKIRPGQALIDIPFLVAHNHWQIHQPRVDRDGG
jgi:hypothetical protein